MLSCITSTKFSISPVLQQLDVHFLSVGKITFPLDTPTDHEVMNFSQAMFNDMLLFLTKSYLPTDVVSCHNIAVAIR